MDGFEVDVTVKITKGEKVIELSLCEAQKVFIELKNLFQKEEARYPIFPNPSNPINIPPFYVTSTTGTDVELVTNCGLDQNKE